MSNSQTSVVHMIVYIFRIITIVNSATIPPPEQALSLILVSGGTDRSPPRNVGLLKPEGRRCGAASVVPGLFEANVASLLAPSR